VEDEPIVSAIMQQKASVKCPENPWQEWQRRNDWRAEGLLRFVGLRLPLEMTRVQIPVPPYKMLFDLPSYCFDMHTRVGLEMLKRLVQGVEGTEGIRELFQRHKIKGAHRAVGTLLRDRPLSQRHPRAGSPVPHHTRCSAGLARYGSQVCDG